MQVKLAFFTGRQTKIENIIAKKLSKFTNNVKKSIFQ